MNGNTILDYFELQLTPSGSSSRCELFVISDGQREKLASGFLKQFLSHLRAAREQYTGGSQVTMRLRCSQEQDQQHSWFNRGTLQRFSRFVSTPEVLERAKSIEDELVQLEQVWNIQASSLCQGGDGFADASAIFSRAGVALPSAPIHETYFTTNQQLQFSCDLVNSEADASKMELLRAMDGRLLALRQDQAMAFSRAAAAGFDAHNIKDLIAFSDYFGAERLRAACNQYLELCARRQKGHVECAEPEPHAPHVTSSSSDMSITSPNGTDSLQEMDASLYRDNRDAQWELQHVNESIIDYIARDEKLETQRKWAPSDIVGLLALPSKGKVDHFEGVTMMRELDRGEAVAENSSESTITATSDSGVGRSRATSALSSNSNSGESSSGKLSPETALPSQASSNRGILQRSSSPKRRSASPLKRVQVGRLGSRRGSGSVAVRSINYFACHSSKERNSLVESCSSDSDEDQAEPVSVVAARTPARRLSVQAAISLFEGKQQILEKQASSRGSMEDAHSYTACEGVLVGIGSDSNEADSHAPFEYHDWQHHKCGSSSASNTLNMQTNLRGCDLQVVKSSASNFSLLEGPAKSEVDNQALSSSAKANFSQRPTDSGISSSRSTLTSLGMAGEKQGSGSVHFEVEVSPLERQGGSCSTKRGVSGEQSESLGSSWITTSDASMQALVQLVDHPMVEDECQSRLEGRYYEQYTKLRDAKLMEEHHSKRAEREAKFKYMKETLELSKAEMDARNSRLSRKNTSPRVNANMSGGSKVDACSTKNGQESTRPLRDQRVTISSPSSPPSAALDSKEHALTPKPPTPKKNSGTILKPQPRGSSRASLSVSPKSTPRGTTIGASSQRHSASTQRCSASSPIDNPLTRSVPCFGDLRKENTKPSPGKSPARAHVKNGGGAGWARIANEPAPLESSSNVLVPSSTIRSRVAKTDKKHRHILARKSCVSSDFKQPNQEEVLVKGQKELILEASSYSKLRRSSVAPIQEVKPFLRKGCGIGPGAGPGVVKLKASSTVDAARSSDEDALLSEGDQVVVADNSNSTSGDQAMDQDDEDANRLESISVLDSARKEVECRVYPVSSVLSDVTLPEDVDAGKDGECLTHSATTFPNAEVVNIDGNAASDVDATHHSLDVLFALNEDGEKSDTLVMEEDMLDNERGSHTISFPIDFETHKRYASSFTSEPQSILHQHKEAIKKQGDSVTLFQLIESNQTSVRGAPSTKCNSLVHENPYIPQVSPVPVAASPSSSACMMRPIAVSDHFSPSAAHVESPHFESPASWSSQMQYGTEAEALRSRKKWGGAHKSNSGASSKEPAKGLKRLLNFARKNRTSEAVCTDTVSTSTPSELDDDSEDVKETNIQSMKLPESSLKDQKVAHDNRTNQSFQSSIPAPPSHFKLRDDRSTKGTSIKGPRSFFSLSTFRSRGSEGKSR